MRNRKKSGQHSAKDLEVCLRHMVGKLLSFSQHQTDIKRRKKKEKAQAWFTKGQKIYG